jgi:hypothetical protein
LPAVVEEEPEDSDGDMVDAVLNADAAIASNDDREQGADCDNSLDSSRSVSGMAASKAPPTKPPGPARGSPAARGDVGVSVGAPDADEAPEVELLGDETL